MAQEHGIFEESVRQSEGRPVFTFYDGPPFATGLPHYGHILAGTIKDVVCRYAHQTGHHVPRRFGWDCHGLPVEFEIDKKLGISSREDVFKALLFLKAHPQSPRWHTLFGIAAVDLANACLGTHSTETPAFNCSPLWTHFGGAPHGTHTRLCYVIASRRITHH